MTDGGMTVTGLAEFQRAVSDLPTRVLESSRRVAQQSAQRIQAGARSRLTAGTKGTGATAAAIDIANALDEQAILVISRAPSHSPANLPLWLEYGFTLRDGRQWKGLHYMHDATKADEAIYQREMTSIVEQLVRDAVT